MQVNNEEILLIVR